MSTLFNTLFQTIKEELPNINWSLGSVVRTLVVDPLTHIAEALGKLSTESQVYNELDLAISRPTEYEDVLDAWMARLHIEVPTTSRATGSVKIVRNNNNPMTIEAGTVFQWGSGLQLYAIETSILDADSYEEVVPAVAYVAEIDVIAGTDLPLSLASGDPINWHGANADISDVYIGKPVAGGVSLTPADKARLLSEALSNPTVAGSTGVRATLLRKFPGTIADVAVGGRQTSSASAHVPVYVKQSQLPEFTSTGKITTPQADEAIAWLNSKQVGCPFRLVGCQPTYVRVRLTIQADTDNSDIRILSALCEYVNGSVLNATLSDAQVEDIIRDRGLELKSPVVYTATIGYGASSYTVTQTGSLSLIGITGNTDAPYALYCDMNSITLY